MSSLIAKIKPLYELEIRLATRLQDVFLLVIRLYWGWQFFLTGKGKLMNIERTSEFFGSLGIPLPTLNAYAAGSVECFGGLLLLLGVASRIITIPLISTMCVAYLTAHHEQLFGIFRNPDDFVSALPFLFLLAALLVFLFGPGKFSVDGWLGHLFQTRAAGNIEQPATQSDRQLVAAK